MKWLFDTFKTNLVALATAGMLGPQGAWAGNHNGSHGSGGGSGKSSSSTYSLPNHATPAANGNTGFTGLGLPKSGDQGQHDGHDSSKSKGDLPGIQLGGGVVLPKDVKAAPNGNTGFTGLGVPGGNGKSTTSFTATSGSSLGVFSSMGASANSKFNRASILAGDKVGQLKTTQLIGRNDDGSGSSTSTGGRNSNNSTGEAGTSSGPNGNQRPNHNNSGEAPREDGQIHLQYPTLSTMQKQGLGILADSNLVVGKTPQTPNSSVTKLKADSNLKVKPLVDQEVHIGPKLPGENGAVSSISSAVDQKATNSGIIIIGGKNAAVNTTLQPVDAAGDTHSGFTGRHPTSQSNSSSDGNSATNEMKTDLKANAQYREPTLKAPSFQVTKLTTDAGLNVKPLVDQEVHVGPKLPGPQASTALLKTTTAASGALANSVATGNKTTLIDNNPKHTDSAPGDPTAGSTKHHKNHDKDGDKNAPSQAVLDAQKAKDTADQTYIDAQNKASYVRGQLGAAEGQLAQAEANLKAAGDAYSKNPTAANSDAFHNADLAYKDAAYSVAHWDRERSLIDPQVAAATVAKNKADADLSAAQAAQASQQTQQHSDSSSKIIPAPNGNTGISGIGLPHASASGGSPMVGMDAAGSGAASTPATASGAPATTTATAKAIETGADLVLENITLTSPATLIAGPAYTVKFRNQGTHAASAFQVAVLAGLDGKLSEDAPRAAIEIPTLAAGEAKEVTLRLPQSALQMSGADGQSAAFTHLFVAVDLMNAVAETDETNNTAVVQRAALE